MVTLTAVFQHFGHTLAVDNKVRKNLKITFSFLLIIKDHKMIGLL